MIKYAFFFSIDVLACYPYLALESAEVGRSQGNNRPCSEHNPQVVVVGVIGSTDIIHQEGVLMILYARVEGGAGRRYWPAVDRVSCQ